MLNEFVETLKSVNVDISEVQPCPTSSGCSVLIVVLTNTFRITFQLCGRAGRMDFQHKLTCFTSINKSSRIPNFNNTVSGMKIVVGSHCCVVWGAWKM